MQTSPAIHPTPDTLADAFHATRQRSTALCAPLEIDDYQIQSVPETSPPKWHLAHITWFFETFLLKPFLPGYRSPDERYAHIFNSYYNTLGAFHPRLERHVLSRPTVPQVLDYREHVDRQMTTLLARDDRPDVVERTILGINHEQQHQELLLMDIKRNFFANPMLPVYRHTQPPQRSGETTQALRWLTMPAGVREIGYAGKEFSFDNECPRHRVFINDWRIGSRLVTNAEYAAFIDAGGYREPGLWLSDGWTAVQQRQWDAPLYWRKIDGNWHEFTLHGLHPLDPSAPVCHVSFYEADAYARWSGCRLPTEAEWEVSSDNAPIEGSFAEAGTLHPQPARDVSDAQWFGEVWQWTSSSYSPYPGYRAPAGALGEYNGKFMANQYVLRGGCAYTPRSHIRRTYRNFFYPHDRWALTGIRLAADA